MNDTSKGGERWENVMTHHHHIVDGICTLCNLFTPQDDTSNTELDAQQHAQQHLYDLFGQNFLDGDKPDEWKAATMNASEVKEFIDEFVVPYLAQREQAAELRGCVKEATNQLETAIQRLWALDREACVNWLDRQPEYYHRSQATKPEKE